MLRKNLNKESRRSSSGGKTRNFYNATSTELISLRGNKSIQNKGGKLLNTYGNGEDIL